MSLIDLERRLARLKAARYVSAPTGVLTGYPIGDLAGDQRPYELATKNSIVQGDHEQRRVVPHRP